MKISIDKKNAFLIIFTLACLSIGAAILLNGWYSTWTALHIPTLSPPFADMRSVQGSLLSARQGFNPQVNNPGDPWNRVLNYPILWFWIAKLFQLDNETNFVIFVFVYILGYIASCFLLLRKSPSLYLLLAFFSGASLLAVERGNNDVLAFVLVFVGISYTQGYFRALLVLLTTILKVYPAFLVVTLAKKPKIFFLLVLVIAGYLLFNIGELQILQAGNTALTDPAGVFASYGFETNMRIIQQILLPGQSADIYSLIKYIFIPVSLFLIALISRIKSLNQTSSAEDKTDLFVSGAIIFSGTYLITSNWDYRLIFLLLCMPHILSIQSRFVKHSTLIGIIISSNATFISQNFGLPGLLLCAISKYYIFLMISACLVRELYNYLSVFSFASGKAHFTK
jgi:hypothetical protein